MILPGYPIPLGGLREYTYEEVQSLPAMTSATSPSGNEVTQSSYYVAGKEGWLAFNQLSGFGDVWVSGLNQWDGSWICRKTPSPIRVWKYRITWRSNYAGAGTYPDVFSLQGSNDGSSWDTLHSGTGPFASGVTREFEVSLMPSAYLYHRLLISEIGGGGNPFAAVSELELLQAL